MSGSIEKNNLLNSCSTESRSFLNQTDGFNNEDSPNLPPFQLGVSYLMAKHSIDGLPHTNFGGIGKGILEFWSLCKSACSKCFIKAGLMRNFDMENSKLNTFLRKT